MRPAVFTIPLGPPFLDALARGLLRRGPATIRWRWRACTVLLPTRRAVARAARGLPARQRAASALLLPRLRPVGDLDADELCCSATAPDGDGQPRHPAGGPGAAPPAAADPARARLGPRARHAGRCRRARRRRWRASWRASSTRCRAKARRSTQLASAGAGELAEHWQQCARASSPSSRALAARCSPRSAPRSGGAAQPRAARRRRSAGAASRRAHPVIAAGITGGVAGRRRSARRRSPGCRTAPSCCPASTATCDDESWGEIAADPAHPQHLLARLLRRLELDAGGRRDCRRPAPASPRGRAARRLVAEVLRPAATTDRWRALAGARRRTALDGSDAARLRRPAGEARGHRAAAAPDARRRRARPRRWSRPTAIWRAASPPSCGAGTSRSTIPPACRSTSTPPGAFLRLVLDARARAIWRRCRCSRG